MNVCILCIWWWHEEYGWKSCSFVSGVFGYCFLILGFTLLLRPFAFGSCISSSFHDWIGSSGDDGGWGVTEVNLLQKLIRKRRAWCRASFLRRPLLRLSHCNYLSIPLIVLGDSPFSCFGYLVHVVVFLVISYTHCWGLVLYNYW